MHAVVVDALRAACLRLAGSPMGRYLQRQEPILGFLLREFRHGFVLADAEYGCVLANQCAANFFGVPLPELLGQRLVERFSTDPERHHALLAARREGSTQPFQVDVTRRDGSRAMGLVAPQPLFESGLFFGSFETLTEMASYVDSPHLKVGREEEDPSDGAVVLTPREREILTLFRVGLATQTIAGRLHLSPNTVRNHLKNICQKYEVGSQIELRERFAQPRLAERP